MIKLFRCADCDRRMRSMTQVCEEGVVICDDCMRADKWRLWLCQNWPGWPRVSATQANKALQ